MKWSRHISVLALLFASLGQAQTIVVGGNSSISGAPTGPAGGCLAGTYPNPSGIGATCVPNSALVNPAATVNGQTCTLGSTCSVSAPQLIGNYSGADLAAKANACLTAVGSGGTCDGSLITGAQTGSTTMAVGARQTLLLPCVAIASSAATAALTLDVGSRVIGCGSGGGTSGTVPTKITVSTSGANGVQASCLGSCSTVTKPDGSVIQGIMFVASNVGTGIGFDFSAFGQGYFADLTFNNFKNAIFNSVSCGSGSVSCNYNQFTGIHIAAPNGWNGIHISKSANANNFFNVNVQGGLVQYLVQDDTDQTNIPNQFNCYGCVVESTQTLLSAPSAPSISGAGGAGTAAVKVSCATAAGETLPSAESTIATLNGNNLVITAPTCATGSLGWRPYVGPTTGTEVNNVAAGGCSAITINGQSICALGVNWTQSGALSSTTAVPSTVNSSGAGIAVVLGQSINFIGGRCEPGGTLTDVKLCAQTFPSGTAGPLLLSGVYFQFSSSGAIVTQDQSGLMKVEDAGATYQSWRGGLDTSSAPNLLPNYSCEAFSGTTALNGWVNVSATNWAFTTEVTKDTSNVASGTNSCKLGDTNNISRGIAPAYQFAIDQTRPYTLALTWATADATVGVFVNFRLYNSAGTVINDQGARIFAAANTGNGGAFSSTNLAFSSACNCFRTSALLQTATNTKRQLILGNLKFPAGTASAWLAITVGGAAPGGSTTIWVDDMYFSMGTAIMSPAAAATACNVATVAAPCEPVYARPVRDTGNGGIETVSGWLATPAGAVLSVSGNAIVPTGPIHHVGAGLIKNITVPTGFPAGGVLNIVPDQAYTTDATGNISLASTAVINKVMVMVWDGTKWNPSY